MNRRTAGFRLFANCAACCLALAGVAHLYLYDASENAVARSMRHDVSWVGVNGRVEAAHLEKYIARHMALATGLDRAAALLLCGIQRSRMDTSGSGAFKRFIEASPSRQARFEALSKTVDSLAADMAQLAEPDAQRRALQTLAEAAPTLDRIGAEADSETVAEAAVIRDEIHDKQRLEQGLVNALLLCGLAFLAVLVLQYRSLRAAHQDTARHAEQLSFLASHDALTKLPSRGVFASALKTALASQRDGETVAVAAIGLDGFKAINDTLGHSAGDALLVAVSDRLVAALAQSDPRNLACRVGGDEFLVLLWTSANSEQTLEATVCLAEAFAHPFETAHGTLIIGGSIGLDIAIPGCSEDLVRNAALALTEAKTQGKGLVLRFDPRLRAVQQRRRRIEADVEEGLAKGHIAPHYQPQLDLVSGRPVGVEALARWHHPELGPISPAEFIPIAESSGSVTRIGRLILEAACRDAVALPEHIRVSVNLSVIQILKDDVVGAVQQALRKTGLAPARLTLEVTESAMMTDPDRVRDVLDQLKAVGVSISLDDFGTGYSSLAYLTRFDWDEIKIDRSFIARAANDPINLMIIRLTRVLARKMNAKVAVEGVETLEQRDLVRSIGCDTAQGYLFSPPLPLAELMPLLGRSVPTPRSRTT
jgi:diguanylate cyclase (GGDEF)-like protein